METMRAILPVWDILDLKDVNLHTNISQIYSLAWQVLQKELQKRIFQYQKSNLSAL